MLGHARHLFRLFVNYAALLGIDAPEAFKRRFRSALIELDFNDALTPNYYSD
jgi:hypothetical protein